MLRRMSTFAQKPTYSSIEKKIKESLLPQTLNIFDDSHKHAHHAAMKGLDASETHFRIEIVSKEFEGKSLLQRHRIVHALLDHELKNGVHALSITAKTPAEVGSC